MESHDENRTWTTGAFGSPETVEKSKKTRMPVILFAITVLSTIWAGCLHQGVNVFAEPWNFYKGLPFAFTLLLILGVHESGHYVMCKIHKVPATVPYFIPMPNILGTMGAFIRIKGAISNRRALLDIGMAGPLAGFVIALPATVIGYHLSNSVPTPEGEGLILGRSLLTWFLESSFLQAPGPGYSIMLHPIGFAGYIGLFVTAMNLLPVGQLDGSHVVTALLGTKQHTIAKITLFLLFVSGLFWQGWWLWAFLLLMTGIRHPVIRYDARAMGRTRKTLAWITIVIFFLTFVPIPFSFGTFSP